MTWIPTMVHEDTVINYLKYKGDDSFAIQLAEEVIANLPYKVEDLIK